MVGPYTATFSAGSNITSFNVSIINDNVLESDENFILTIDPSSLPSNVTAGTPNHSTITIMDEESMYLIDDLLFNFWYTVHLLISLFLLQF